MKRPTGLANVRRLALEIVGTWQRLNVPGGSGGPFLDDLLAETLAAYPHLPRPDQALLRELATGVMRWRGRLDYVIGQTASKPVSQLHPLVLDLLRLTAYQLLFLDRIPPRAAVHEAVKLAKARRLPPVLVAFVNAVGRSMANRTKEIHFPDPETEPGAALAAATSLPSWLAARWLENLGRDAWDRAQASTRHPPLTVRVNTVLSSREALGTVLEAEGVANEPCRYSPWGLTLLTLEQSPFHLPSYQQGLWIFQDEAAQLTTLLLQPRPGQQILEIGAGRGGKTTHLAQLLHGQGRILAVDNSPVRLAALRQNLQRLGLTGVDLLRADAATFLPLKSGQRFDRILIDAPCSGLGVLRRHPELRWRRHPEDMARFAARQKAMLQQAASFLRVGGVLLYITCTTETEENEGVVQDFLDSHPAFSLQVPTTVLPTQAQRFIEMPGYFRTLPERDGLDGFFAVALVKEGSR